ncbi:MAG: hypothetical protein FJX54_21450 [Alphaproteobacteria bacterium]|nr:hypothetical protein [Alphaproteobacteria bacterium]
MRSSGLRALVLVLFWLLWCMPAFAEVGIGWAQSFGASGGTTTTTATTTDSSGNVYVAGTFTSATLAVGTVTLTRLGTTDSFIAKFDSYGRATWAKNFGGTGAATSAAGIAVDASSNVYVAGQFRTASLTTPGLTKIGTVDAFAIKLDSSGTVTWARNYGGAGATASFTGIAVDTAIPANVYAAGSFTSANLTTPALTKLGDSDALVMKLNSTGATSWSKNYGGTGSYAFANGIAVDAEASANVYVGGGFHYLISGNTAAALTTPALTRIGEIDGLVLKIHTSGTLVWSKNYGGVGASTSINRVAVDRESPANIFLTGYLQTANLTTPAVTRVGTQDGLVFKLDSSGATTWTKSINGTGSEASVVGIALDTASPANVYIGGSFGTSNLTTPALARIGDSDSFGTKLDSTGAVVWAKNLGGTGAFASAGKIAVDSTTPASIYVASDFLGANLTTPPITKAGSTDGLLVKLAAPESGWWWSSSESGRGYSIEIDRGRLFFAAYGYASNGDSVWYVSSGTMTSDTRFSGTLEAFEGGQTLTGSYRAPTALGSVGNLQIDFTSSRTATLTLPSGATVSIARYDITTGGSQRGPASGYPRKGWWWNSTEAGRGFFFEVQDSTLFVSGFLYDSSGRAAWYVSSAAMITSSVYIGTFTEFGGGASFSTTPFTGPTTATGRGLVSIQFDTPSTATMTLSTGAQVTLTRFSF